MIRYQKLPKEIVDSLSEESLVNNLFYKNDNEFIGYLEVREDYGIISKNIRTTGLIFSDDIKYYFPKHKLNALRLNKSIIRKESLISPILATDYNVIRTVKIIHPIN